MTSTWNLVAQGGALVRVVNPSGPGTYSLLYRGQTVPPPDVLLFDLLQWTGDGTGTRVIPTTLDLSTGGFIHVMQDTSPFRCLMLWSADGSTVWRSLASFGTVATTLVAAPYAMANNSFTVATGQNTSGVTYTAYVWRRYAGFCDVVDYVGTGNGNINTVAHSLGVEPEIIFVRQHETSGSSPSCKLYHEVNTIDDYMAMESTGIPISDAGCWGNTVPDATQFQVADTINNDAPPSPDGWLAVLLAGDGVTMDTGTYVGNGLSAGPTITCGFEPDVVLVKCIGSGSRDWNWVDQARSPGFTGSDSIFESNTEIFTTVDAFALSGTTGFQIVSSNVNYNQSGRAFIYLAMKKS